MSVALLNEPPLALPSGGEYYSQVLPEVRLDLAAFWGEVALRLPSS